MQPSARQAITPSDRSLVDRIDRAWNTGSPKAVLSQFQDVHPQARTALGRRVRAATGTRKSSILGVSNHERCRCIYLETELGGSRKLFEVLVLARDRKLYVPRMLYATDPIAQARVSVPHAGKQVHGLPFGTKARFSCPACNYTVGSPDMGDWLVFAGGTDAQSIEKIDVFNLDKDLALELAVHMTPDTPKPMALSEIVSDAAVEMAKRMGVEPSATKSGKLEVSGLEAPYEAIDIRDPRTGKPRRYMFLAVRKAPSCYLMLFQGTPANVTPKSKDVLELLGTFRILDPKRTPAAGTKALVSAHTGGRLVGNTFEFPALGLRLTGVAGWKPQIGIGKDRFQVIWNCPLTKSKLILSGVAWRAPDSDAALSSWLDAWLDRQSDLHGNNGFRYDPDCTRKTIAGREFRVLSYEYRPKGSNEFAKAQLAIRIQGNTLIVIDTIAMPGSHQAENLRALDTRVGALELR